VCIYDRENRKKLYISQKSENWDVPIGNIWSKLNRFFMNPQKCKNNKNMK
jgi:hypothetical protein